MISCMLSPPPANRLPRLHLSFFCHLRSHVQPAQLPGAPLVCVCVLPMIPSGALRQAALQARDLCRSRATPPIALYTCALTPFRPAAPTSSPTPRLPAARAPPRGLCARTGGGGRVAAACASCHRPPACLCAAACLPAPWARGRATS